MDYQALVPVTGVITAIRRQSEDCCSQMLLLNTDSGQVNFLLSAETMVLGNIRLRMGMRVMAYYDSRLPVPLIYPPQYQAQVIAVLRPGEQGYLGFFDRRLTAADQSLRLNIANSTTVLTANGQSFSCPPVNQTLFVYYTVTTRSIPPQTTPRKIVVLC